VSTFAAGLSPSLSSASGRQQRNMMAGGAIDLYEVAPAKIRDPRAAEREAAAVADDVAERVVDERPKIPTRNMTVAVLRFDGLRKKSGEAAVSSHCVAV
jgi:hypothetical protein